MPELLEPSRLSRELREGTGPDLKRRRIGIALSMAGVVVGGAVAAFQTGLVKTLPEILPGRVFDSPKVDSSDYAYRYGQQPDAPAMIVNYGLTMMALAAGGEDRATQNPALPIVAAAKAAGDFALCSLLAVQEWKENKKLCSYCQVATLISAATTALTIPEAVRAARGGGATVH